MSVSSSIMRKGWCPGVRRPMTTGDGLLTGLHEPEASHLQQLQAVAGPTLVERAYADVTAPGAPPYLWHEFGDVMLLLP